jgi:hypothetical protein
MSFTRLLVLALIVVLPLTAFLAFAAGDVFVPHHWGKHARHPGGRSDDASRMVVKLPSGITTTLTSVVALPLLGPLVATALPPASSIALRPPFVPPRV